MKACCLVVGGDTAPPNTTMLMPVAVAVEELAMAVAIAAARETNPAITLMSCDVLGVMKLGTQKMTARIVTAPMRIAMRIP